MACSSPRQADHAILISKKENKEIVFSMQHGNGKTIAERFKTPAGFIRTEVSSTSFAQYLRDLPLKPAGTEVKLYNGLTKYNSDIYDAVIDLPIGHRDLHQCADAIMRLKAEYLFNQKRYEDIHFNFTNGFRADYSMWKAGKRVAVEGNRCYWKQVKDSSISYQDFWKYMEIIFSYAGTISLSKEMIKTSIEDLRIGDVFIQGGSPGHAVIVVDVAINEVSKDKVFLLAQSYMPAQEIQLLKNPNAKDLSPWYKSDFKELLITPEWTFSKGDLKRFAE